MTAVRAAWAFGREIRVVLPKVLDRVEILPALRLPGAAKLAV